MGNYDPTPHCIPGSKSSRKKLRGGRMPPQLLREHLLPWMHRGRLLWLKDLLYRKR
jgi:hypothetical protein